MVTYITWLLAAKHAHELGQVLKVAGHLGGQDHVDDGAACRLVCLLVQVLENVDLVVAWKYGHT